MNEVFKKECKELGIPFNEFPFSFGEGCSVNYSTIIEAMMWILKKRQDKQNYLMALIADFNTLATYCFKLISLQPL